MKVLPTDEILPEGLIGEKSAIYLAEQKAKAFSLLDDELLITADTEVWFQNHRLGKPANSDHAYRLLQGLSGQTHEVISGVCLTTKTKQISFAVTTKVTFGELSEEQIAHYIAQYNPFDKAGGYGIQEWIGWVGIKGLHGSYSNVVGLPIYELNQALMQFLRR